MSDAPLSAIMKDRASEYRTDPSDVQSRRDSLMSAYEKLIKAQQYQAPPVHDLARGMRGTAQMMASGNPNLMAMAQGDVAYLKGLLGQQEAMQSSEASQSKTFLEQQKAALDILNGDREAEYKYLTAAGNSEYKDDMARLKELMLYQKASATPDDETTTASSAETAKALGVPAYAGPDPYAGLDKVGKRQLRMGFEKKLGQEQDAAGELQSAIDRMKRFQQLNEEAKGNLIGTGPIADYVPTFSEGLQEMDAISAEIVPQMRAPGSGSTSDFDAGMFKTATVGTQKDHEVNKNISEAYIASKQNQMQKADYLEQYLSANGHLRGAEQQWKKYLNENPIFADKKFNLNGKRKTWQDYFGASGGDAGGSQGGSTDSIPKGFDPEDWKYLTPEEQSSIRKKRG